MSNADRYGRDSSRRGRSPSRRSGDTDSSPSYRRAYRSRSRSLRDMSRSHRDRSGSRHGRPTSRHDRSRSRHNRSRSRHEKRKRMEKIVPRDVSDDDSDREVDRDDFDDDLRTTSRAKQLKRIDVEDPLSAFATKTKTRLGHIPASDFAKSNWNTIRGMDPETGKFLVKDRPKPDDWQKMAKSDRLINKWSGDLMFGDTRLDDGLSSVVPKVVSKEETDLMKTQRAIGALGHMVLSASEGFSKLYKKMSEYVLKNIGGPATPNPEFDETAEDNGSVKEYIYADHQNSAFAEFQELQREWQLDVSEPLAIAARTAAAWHIKIMAVRREKIIAKISKVNQKAANAISKIPPSAHGMFGGDAAELEKVVKLSRDLGGSAKQNYQPFQGSSASSAPNRRGGGNQRGRGGGSFTPRGGGNFGRGGGFTPRKGRGSKNFTRGT